MALSHEVQRHGAPAAQDPVLRQKMASSLVELECLRLHSLHVLTELEAGRDLGPEASLTKLQWSETHQDLGEVFTDVAGLAHQVATPETAALQDVFLWSRSETIWGGSSQVQRNVVAERVLGLPR